MTGVEKFLQFSFFFILGMIFHAIFLQQGPVEPEPHLARVQELETQLEHCLYLSSQEIRHSFSPSSTVGLTIETCKYLDLDGACVGQDPEIPK